MRHVGFTGTRYGMTTQQRPAVKKILRDLYCIGFGSFHHGDCVGADAEACSLAVYMMHAFFHPPVDETHRANYHVNLVPGSYTMLPSKTHFARNRDIVDASDIMVAAPPTKPLPKKGGTLYTIQYALKTKTPLHIVYPDGSVDVFE